MQVKQFILDKILQLDPEVRGAAWRILNGLAEGMLESKTLVTRPNFYNNAFGERGPYIATKDLWKALSSVKEHEFINWVYSQSDPYTKTPAILLQWKKNRTDKHVTLLVILPSTKEFHTELHHCLVNLGDTKMKLLALLIERVVLRVGKFGLQKHAT